MHNVILSLGTNLGDRVFNMRSMERYLQEILTGPIQQSRCMETEPLGMAPGSPWFFNRLLGGRYHGTARELLLECQGIERKLGRREKSNKASRTADIDILIFGDTVCLSDDLTLPHRCIADRRFCLEGLYALAPGCMVPGTGKNVEQLFDEMDEAVKKQHLTFIEL